VTVVYPKHGLTGLDHIDATGSSTAGYNVTRAQVQYVDAHTFRYEGPGTGVPTAAPKIRRYARYRIDPNRNPKLNVYPVEPRRWPGNPNDALLPLFVGEEVYDYANATFYRARTLRANTWSNVTPAR
jgi:hypothetical protein